MDRYSARRGDDAEADRSPSRRAVLIGGAAVVLAGGAGVAAGRFTGAGRTTPTPRPAPAALLAALREEEGLLAAADAVLIAQPSSHPLVTEIRRDHRAHLAALRAALAPYDQPRPSAGSTSAPASPAAALPQDRAALRTRERQAGDAGARRAARLTGRNAALLASIAACEAGHGELLS